jgi:hypothetical protein
MAVCIGFVRSHLSKSAWTRCARKAARRERLCAEHRDGLDGALLGMVKFEEILPWELAAALARKPKKKRLKRRKKSSPAWDTRNVAAATTTPERLEPHPARACPAPTFKNESCVKPSEAEI